MLDSTRNLAWGVSIAYSHTCCTGDLWRPGMLMSRLGVSAPLSSTGATTVSCCALKRPSATSAEPVPVRASCVTVNSAPLANGV